MSRAGPKKFSAMAGDWCEDPRGGGRDVKYEERIDERKRDLARQYKHESVGGTVV